MREKAVRKERRVAAPEKADARLIPAFVNAFLIDAPEPRPRSPRTAKRSRSFRGYGDSP
jgi:hypothetical protein